MQTRSTEPSPALEPPNAAPACSGFFATRTAAFWAFVAAAVLVCMVYVLYTGHIWEDYLITYRFSENLAHGKGLVFNPGERVHGFTSVINTGIPAFFALFTQPGEYLLPLWAYRICSLLAFVAGGGAVFSLLLQDKHGGHRSAWLFACLLLLSQIVIAFTMNGQEAGFMILFVALAFIAGYKGYKDHWRLAALAWTGLLYTRPDTPVIIAAATLCSLWDFRAFARDHLHGMLKAGVAAALAYLPWFIFAWIYFGSPVPHTITAKNSTLPFTGEIFANQATSVATTTASMLQWSQLPIYALVGGWPWYWWISALVLGLWGGTYWIWAGPDRLGGYASRLALIMAAYLAFLNTRLVAYPWYFPPVILLLAIALAQSIARLRTLTHPWVFRLLTAAILARTAAIFVLAVHQIHFQQETVENSVRTQVGLWLKANAQPTDTVHLEPLGYIGYFSGLVMHDWPGLVSPTVVRLRREIKGDRYQIIPALNPDWLVLRPLEWEDMQRSFKGPVPYRIVHVVTQYPRLMENTDLPGWHYVASDITFLILKRVEAPPRTH